MDPPGLGQIAGEGKASGLLLLLDPVQQGVVGTGGDLDTVAGVVVQPDNGLGDGLVVRVVEPVLCGKQPLAVVQMRQLLCQLICLAVLQIKPGGGAADAHVSRAEIRENVLCHFQGDESRAANLRRVLFIFHNQLRDIVLHVTDRIAQMLAAYVAVFLNQVFLAAVKHVVIVDRTYTYNIQTCHLWYSSHLKTYFKHKQSVLICQLFSSSTAPFAKPHCRAFRCYRSCFLLMRWRSTYACSEPAFRASPKSVSHMHN